MLHKIIRGLAPIAAIVLAAGVAGCDGMNIRINDEDGVPLSELDMSGEAPTELVLAGPDSVVIIDGATLDIDVEGDQEAIDKLRFSLSDGALAIMRESGNWSNSDGRATVRVTMPSPEKIVLAGSGGVAAQSMAANAEVTIAGSGRVDVGNLSAEKLEVNVMGSGTFGAAGTAKVLDLTIAGSGNAEMAGLKVDTADISIAGSGDAVFASDGKVDASIAGSGDVELIGRATCKVSSMGSGSVTCRASASDDDADNGDES